MTLRVFDEVEQGTEAWHDVRRGIVTASVMHHLVTPKTLKTASNDASRGLANQLVAERLTGYTEPTFASPDMVQGKLDEPLARDAYSQHEAPVTQVGFMVRDDWGFSIGYSPDGLVGSDGLIEIKSRRQKAQLATFLADAVPVENMAQIQTGLLVSGRDWCDYVSYCGGMHLYVKRVWPEEDWQHAILDAVGAFEANAEKMIERYQYMVVGRPLTERIDHFPEIEF